LRIRRWKNDQKMIKRDWISSGEFSKGKK